MPFLKRPRQSMERLPDGRSVQEAVNQSGGYDLQGALGQQGKQNPQLPPVTEMPLVPSGLPSSTVQPPAPQTALSKVGEPPPEMTWNPITVDQYGKPSVSPGAKGNRADILEKQFEADQAWEPKPHGNRLIGALKSARDAIRLNARPGMTPGEVIGTALGGGGVGAATRNPDLYGKEIEERKTLGDLSTALGVEKERAQVSNMGLVPVTLNDGRMVMVPRAKAADLQDKQQTQSLNRDKATEQANQNQAHRARWAAMGRKERKAQITAEYKAGMLTTPQQLQDAADELEIKGDLKPAFIRGEMRDALDTEGNIIEASRRTGNVTTATQDGKPVQSFAVTQEGNRNQRAKDFLNASLARQQTQIAATASTYGNAGEMESDIADWKQQAKDKRAEASRIEIKTQADLDRQRQLTKDASDLEKAGRDLKIHANKARNVQNASPQTAPSLKGRTISQSNFDKYKQDHGDAAAQKLLDGGVTIRQ